jgi:Tfp pilus assembly protein PilV
MPKPSIAQTLLVMMRTFSARLRVLGRSSIGGSTDGHRSAQSRGAPQFPRRAERGPRSTRVQFASAAGDTLIEVLISALLVGLIVVGTFSGLDSTTKATALQRSRSQADALAEQDEERLRSLPINALVALQGSGETNPVKVGNTEYTVKSSTTYIADATSTESCSASSNEADYLQTTSKVTWTSLGKGKPVEETGIISPPPGANLIVQVTESGTALPKATVTVTELTPKSWTHTLETSTKGCAIFALPEGGEYAINAHKTGYVTPNGYPNTDEDEKDTQKVYIPAETTSKEGFSLGLAGKIQVKFTPEGETFTIFNTGITSFTKLGNAPHQASLAWFGTEHTYTTQVETPAELYPFTTHYIVYAGQCEADKPPSLTSENEVVVAPGGTGATTLTLPQLTLEVYSGTSISKVGLLTGASGSATDTGCSVKHSFTTTNGAMPHPGLPYGTYKLCVTALVGSPAKQRRYEKEIHITSASGVKEVINLGSEPESILTSC